MAGRMKDKVVLVSGAGSVGPGWGNGKASAVVYAREGAKVFAVDRSEKAALETRDIIRGEGGACEAWACDVTDEAAVESMAAACVAKFGRIDVLHNNVGIGCVGGPLEISLEDWRRTFEVNVASMFLTCKAVLPTMLGQGAGAIVNISSLSAVKAARAEAAYAASKGAVNSLTMSIALQYADRGIRCNAVLPGLMNTPMVHQGLAAHYGGVEALVQKRDATSPTGKQGEGWDVAYAALFLASDEAKYVNGALFPVDGGLQWRIG
jgi:NAD(P)-dependent dehydrogenase (short-subunit alcohol dehydrogenase family)